MAAKFVYFLFFFFGSRFVMVLLLYLERDVLPRFCRFQLCCRTEAISRVFQKYSDTLFVYGQDP